MIWYHCGIIRLEVVHPWPCEGLPTKGKTTVIEIILVVGGTKGAKCKVLSSSVLLTQLKLRC